MSSRLNRVRPKNHQKGLSIVEVMLSLIILGVAIIPALDSIRSGLQVAVVNEDIILKHYSLLSKMNEIKATPFDDLLAAAELAGSYSTASIYSDASGVESRHLVYLSFYDAENSDADNNVFTIADVDTDGDNNPYTYPPTEYPLSLLWVSIEIESSEKTLQTLLLR